jgi:hypothetical protein
VCAQKNPATGDLCIDVASIYHGGGYHTIKYWNATKLEYGTRYVG